MGWLLAQKDLSIYCGKREPFRRAVTGSENSKLNLKVIQLYFLSTYLETAI